jgi:hypothetical protein
LDEIRSNANFALNWDGLFLKMGGGLYQKAAIITNGNTDNAKYEIIDLPSPIEHTSTTILGRTNGVIYNAW